MIVKGLLETLKNIAEVTRTDYGSLKENEVHSLVVDILSKSYSLVNEFDKLKVKENLVEFNKNIHHIQQNLFSLRGTIRKKEIITGIIPCIDTLIVQLSLLQKDILVTELTYGVKISNCKDWEYFPVALYDGYEDCKNKKDTT